MQVLIVPLLLPISLTFFSQNTNTEYITVRYTQKHESQKFYDQSDISSKHTNDQERDAFYLRCVPTFLRVYILRIQHFIATTAFQTLT